MDDSVWKITDLRVDAEKKKILIVLYVQVGVCCGGKRWTLDHLLIFIVLLLPIFDLICWSSWDWFEFYRDQHVIYLQYILVVTYEGEV